MSVSRTMHRGTAWMLGVLLYLAAMISGKTPAFRVLSKGLSSCGKERPMPVELHNTSWSMPENNVFEMSGTLVVKKEIDSPMFGFAILSMCDRESTHCTNVMSHSFGDVCDELSRNNSLLNDLAHHVQDFPTNCPIPPGEYVLPPYQFSLHQDTKCGDMGGDWKLKMKLLIPGNDTYMCQVWKTKVEVDC